MLGKLAKWLKILGFDTLFFSRAEDEDLLAAARKEKRILLTRDTGLVERAGDVPTLLLESDKWEDQVRQVLGAFDLWKKVAPHTRCITCNVRLKHISRRNARNLVTPFVFEHADAFAVCPECGRVFWKGTHFKDMAFKIENLLKRDDVKTGA